jgi:hypothetical protein
MDAGVINPLGSTSMVLKIIYFKQKTLANLVLSNLNVEKRLGRKPNIGYQSGEYTFAQ